MENEEIKRIAAEAAEEVKRIPTEGDGKIVIGIYEYSNPYVYYEKGKDGYYQVCEERGVPRKRKIATSIEGLKDHIIYVAIRDYASSYELKHRRKFESHRRQIDEIIEKCYQYIDPSKKFIKESYDDTIHIYFDLLDFYKEVAGNAVKENKSKYEKLGILKDLEFIYLGYYAAKSGGMSDVSMAMKLVRYHIGIIRSKDNTLKQVFDKYEGLYKHVPIDVNVYEKEKYIRIGGRNIKFQSAINDYKVYHDFIHINADENYIIDRYSNVYRIADSENLVIGQIEKRFKIGKEDTVFVSGESLVEALYEGKDIFDELIEERIKKYICMRVLFNIHTARNLERDKNLFLKIHSYWGAMGYEDEIRDVVIKNRYGTFPFGKCELRDDFITKMGLIT